MLWSFKTPIYCWLIQCTILDLCMLPHIQQRNALYYIACCCKQSVTKTCNTLDSICAVATVHFIGISLWCNTFKVTINIQWFCVPDSDAVDRIILLHGSWGFYINISTLIKYDIVAIIIIKIIQLKNINAHIPIII